ncbi:MAG: hypothetical protein ACYTFQ_12675 [Planctomycetota bacterium]
MQFVAGWAGFRAAGQRKEFQWREMRGRQDVAAYKGSIAAAFGVGAVSSTINFAHEANRLIGSKRSVAEVESMLKLSDEKMVRRAPKGFAKLVKLETRETGKEVTHVYVDPAQLVNAAKEGEADPVSVARELMGEEGPDRLNQALSERIEFGGWRATLAVPVEEYLEKWGGKPIAETLLQDSTTKPGNMTAREQKQYFSELDTLSAKLEKEAEISEAGEIVIPENEKKFIDTLKQQLIDSKQQTPDEARKSVAITRAFIRTLAQKTGSALEDQFKHWTLSLNSAILRKPQKTEAETIADKEQIPNIPKFESLQEAFDLATGELAEHDGRDVSPSGSADNLFGTKEDPGPFHDETTFAAVDRELGLEGKDRVRGLRDAWSKLTGEGTKDAMKNWGQVGTILGVLRQVQGLEGLMLPQDVETTILTRERMQDDLAREADHWLDMQAAPDTASSSIGSEATETLRQDKEGVPRGAVDISREGMDTAFGVMLGEFADLSTFQHEMSHVYMEMLGDMSERDDVPRTLKDDYGVLLKWLGAKDRASITEPMKERYAKAFEVYLMEGKAPSSKLAEAFYSFRLWLRQIYLHARRLNVQLDDDIRGFFDRMLATDAEIENARNAAGLSAPPITSAEEGGFTDEQWIAYNNEWRKYTSHAARVAQQRIAKAEHDALKAFKTKEFGRLKKAAEREWDERRGVQAWNYVIKGEWVGDDGRKVKNSTFGKMDREAVRKVMGRRSILEKSLRSRLTIEGGEHPDTVARRFGYEGTKPGEVMLKEFSEDPVKSKDKSAWVQQRAETLTRLANPQIEEEIATLAEVVQSALHDSEVDKAWFLDVSSMRKNVEGVASGKIMDAAARVTARRLAQKQTIRRISPRVVLNRAMAAANEAAAQVAKGNYRGALMLKAKQRLNHHLFNELETAKSDRRRFDTLIRDTLSVRRLERFGKAGKVFVDAIEQILESIRRKPVEPGIEERDSVSTSLAKIGFEEGGNVVDPQEIEAIVHRMTKLGYENREMRDLWKELQVGEMRSLSRTLSQLHKLANAIDKWLEEGKQIRIDQLVDTFEKETADRKDRGAAPHDNNPRMWQGSWATILEPAEGIRKFGPTLYRLLIIEGFKKARATNHAILEDVGSFFGNSWEKLGGEMRRRRFEKMEDTVGVEYPEDMLQLAPMNRQTMWMIGLNMGNQSGRDRLLGGYKWNEEAVLAWLKRNMTEQEWRFIESAWKLLDEKLFPQVQRVYKAKHGRSPPKIPALPIDTGLGFTVSGGYFPARYDPIRSKVIGEIQNSETFHKHAAAISVWSGFTQTRVRKFADVIDLNWNVVPGHILSVAHYIAFDEFVSNAKRLLTNEEFKNIAISRFGFENYQQLVDPNAGWLAHIANTGADAVPKALAPAVRLLQVGRYPMLAGSIMGNIRVALADYANPLLAVLTGRVKVRYMMRSMMKAHSIALLPGMYRRAQTLGAEPKARSGNIQRNTRAMIESVGRGGFGRAAMVLKQIQDIGYIFLDISDRLLTTVTWDAKFEQDRNALKKEGRLNDAEIERRAAEEADDLVSSTMPQQERVMKPTLLRDKRGFARLVIFYGFWNKLYNMMHARMDPALVEFGAAEGYKETFIAGNKLVWAGGATLAMLSVPILLGDLIGGHGQEADEDFDDWMIRKMIAAPFVLIPFGGTIGTAVANKITGRETFYGGGSFRAAPELAGFEKLMKSVESAVDSENEDRILDVIQLIGLASGTFLGSSQIKKTYDYLQYGQDDSYSGTASGVLFGESERDPANPFTLHHKRGE